MPRTVLARLALPLGALALLAAGCGGSAGASDNAGSATGKARQARLDFAKCMRGQGINIPDPGAGGGAARRIGPGGPGGAAGPLANIPAAKRQAALKACGKYLQNSFGNITPAQQAQLRQQALKFAQCMRQHGVNIPDPTTSTGPGGGFAVRRALRSVDRNSPVFKAATTACSSLAPRFGRGGPGGPGGAAPAPAPGA